MGIAKPIREQPYRLSHAYRGTVEEDLKEMFDDGIIVKESERKC